MGKKEIYSYSRLGSFETCKYGYYLNYIKKEKGNNGTYGVLGNKLHSIMEELEHGKITKDIALNMWNEQVDYMDIMGELNFPTEKSKNNYLNDIKSYLETFIPIEPNKREVGVEEYFEIELNGNLIRGYIDLYFIDHEKKEIDIYDYKTSSKSSFSKKNLLKKCYQLILYGIALEKKFDGYKINSSNFDLCKYAKHKENNKIKERCELTFMDEDDYNRWFLNIPFNQSNKQSLIEYISETINQIEALDKNNESNWSPCNNKFYCKNLCSFGDNCKYNK